MLFSFGTYGETVSLAFSFNLGVNPHGGAYRRELRKFDDRQVHGGYQENGQYRVVVNESEDPEKEIFEYSVTPDTLFGIHITLKDALMGRNIDPDRIPDSTLRTPMRLTGVLGPFQTPYSELAPLFRMGGFTTHEVAYAPELVSLFGFCSAEMTVSEFLQKVVTFSLYHTHANEDSHHLPRMKEVVRSYLSAGWLQTLGPEWAEIITRTLA